VKCRTFSLFQSYMISHQNEDSFETAGYYVIQKINLNFTQPVSYELLEVTITCTDTAFLSIWRLNKGCSWHRCYAVSLHLLHIPDHSATCIITKNAHCNEHNLNLPKVIISHKTVVLHLLQIYTHAYAHMHTQPSVRHYSHSTMVNCGIAKAYASA